jgi:hypothetical protein
LCCQAQPTNCTGCKGLASLCQRGNTLGPGHCNAGQLTSSQDKVVHRCSPCLPRWSLVQDSCRQRDSETHCLAKTMARLPRLPNTAEFKH